MQILIWLLAASCIFTLTLHIISIIVALRRCRPRAIETSWQGPAVTIVRPLCGLDHGIEATLRSSFTLDYPRYDLIFCVAHAGDPVVALTQQLMRAYPLVRSRLLIGDERISINPKLNNCVKGWNAATASWIVLADANVLMPRDYLQRLFASWQLDTGLVCAPPIGSAPAGFWAEVECAFLNSYQARWQYFADSLGLGFAQGKTMLWRRDVLDTAGGMRALAAEVAEDAASTKLVRKAGLRVRLVDGPFAQPLGRRELAAVWQRQVRWARLRRASFPLWFAAEIASNGLVTVIATTVTAALLGGPVLAPAAGAVALWYGGEWVLAWACGWPAAWTAPFAAIMRDLIQPAIYAAGWRERGFVWRGNAMTVDGLTARPAPE